MVARHVVNHLPIGWCIVLATCVLHLSVDVLLDNVARFCGTVVIEVVVTINLVGGPEVFNQRHAQGKLLVVGEIEYLFRDHAAKLAILFLEQLGGAPSS